MMNQKIGTLFRLYSIPGPLCAAVIIIGLMKLSLIQAAAVADAAVLIVVAHAVAVVREFRNTQVMSSKLRFFISARL